MKTLEAIIAISLMFIFILTILPGDKKKERIPESIETVQNEITTKIEYDDILRNAVVTNDVSTLTNFIETSKFDNMAYQFVICNIDDQSLCAFPNDLPKKPIYTKSVVIASGTERKIFRLFLWYSI